jgi:electron transfer flavoprotein beta subunit
MGADRSVLLADPAFQEGDPWSNALALAAVARTEGPFDAVFLGLQAADDNFAQAGPLLAEHLALPCATGAMRVVLAEGALTVERELDGDRREVVRLPLPAVVTFQTGSGDTPPRYANIKGIMASKKKEMKTPSPADLGLAPADVGAAGRRLTVLSLGEPPKSAGAEMLTGSPDEIAQELLRRIREKTGVL